MLGGVCFSINLTGNHEFFIRGNYQHLDHRIGCADKAFGSTSHFRVGFRVDPDSQTLKPGTNPGTNLSTVFPDTGSKYDGLGSTHPEEKGARPMTDAIHQDIHSQLSI